MSPCVLQNRISQHRVCISKFVMKLKINEKWQFPSYFPLVWGTKYGKKREKSDCSKWVSEKFPHPVRELWFAAKHTSWTWLMECAILKWCFSLKQKKRSLKFFMLWAFFHEADQLRNFGVFTSTKCFFDFAQKLAKYFKLPIFSFTKVECTSQRAFKKFFFFLLAFFFHGNVHKIF